MFNVIQFCAFQGHSGLQFCRCDSPVSRTLQVLQVFSSLVTLPYDKKEEVSGCTVSCHHVSMGGELTVYDHVV